MISTMLSALSLAAAPVALPADAAHGAKPVTVVRHGGHGGTRVHRWGNRIHGRWHAGWRAPGGWAAYRTPVRGWTLPAYWINPGWRIVNYPVYRLPAPVGGGYWTRYYDDAVMVDGAGRVIDRRGDIAWDGYEGGYAPEDADLDYDMGGYGDERVIARPPYPGGPLPGDAPVDERYDMRGERGTYEGEWRGDYVDRRTYEGEWEGRYTGEDGRVYEGSYAGRMTGAPRGPGADYAPPPAARRLPPPAVPARPAQDGGTYGWQGGYAAYGHGSQAYYGYGYPVYHAAPTTVVITGGAPVTTTTTTVTEEYVYERAPARRVVKKKRAWKPKPKPRCIC